MVEAVGFCLNHQGPQPGTCTAELPHAHQDHQDHQHTGRVRVKGHTGRVKGQRLDASQAMDRLQQRWDGRL